MNRAISLSEQVSVVIDPDQCEGIGSSAAVVAGARLAERFDIDALRHAYEGIHPARVCSGRERLGE